MNIKIIFVIQIFLYPLTIFFILLFYLMHKTNKNLILIIEFFLKFFKFNRIGFITYCFQFKKYYFR